MVGRGWNGREPKDIMFWVCFRKFARKGESPFSLFCILLSPRQSLVQLALQLSHILGPWALAR